ncbi:hypothetical protein FIV30_13525 [Lactiplantibacillus plantarum]|nr:hypothetical protein [Lactiplantibacillus plantarum]
MVNTILKEADLFCPNSVRINFTIYLIYTFIIHAYDCIQKTIHKRSKNAHQRKKVRAFTRT